MLSVEIVADDAGESKDQVRRYIRLTYLIPELLTMVDENKIAFSPAVEISYLEHSEQLVLLDTINLMTAHRHTHRAYGSRSYHRKVCSTAMQFTRLCRRKNQINRSGLSSSVMTLENTFRRTIRTSKSKKTLSKGWNS